MGSILLDSGYVLLGAKDKYSQALPPSVSQLIQQNLPTTRVTLSTSQNIKLIRWACQTSKWTNCTFIMEGKRKAL